MSKFIPLEGQVQLGKVVYMQSSSAQLLPDIRSYDGGADYHAPKQEDHISQWLSTDPVTPRKIYEDLFDVGSRTEGENNKIDPVAIFILSILLILQILQFVFRPIISWADW